MSDRRPHAIFFRALIAHQSATSQRRIISRLKKHYLSGSSRHCHSRDVCNIEIILWLYEQTKDRRLLQQAIGAYRSYNRITTAQASTRQDVNPGLDTTLAGMLSPKPGSSHGVTYNEICKLPAILYMHTGKKKYLQASLNAVDE